MREIALVATGGALGTLARYGLDESIGVIGDVPASTLTVNLLGAFALGLLLGSQAKERLRLLLGTGVIGGFTTYSAFAVQVHTLAESSDRWLLGVAYALLTVVLGFIAAATGLTWARR